MQHQLIHQAFEAQADSTPDAVAVMCEEQSLTYGDLNRMANRLARYLRKHGVVAGKLVGICMERGVDMIVALLAVLKAGAAYLPMDPTHPDGLLSSILGNAAPQAVLTHDCLRGRIASASAVVISVDARSEEIALQEAANEELCAVTADALAYVIYTSGSTGKPKGVMVEHRNVIHLWRALERILYRDFGADVRIGVNASLAFDASVKQLVQLLSGRTLCVIPQAARLSPREFLSFIARYRVDCFDCTPTQLRELLEAGLLSDHRCGSRLVLVGGEAIEPALWQELAASADVEFFNLYGPTECTVDTTAARIAGRDPTIGRPLENVRVHVLDEQRRAVSGDTVGEIYIGGAGVARGYWNRPDLTDERFVPDPFSGTNGDRLYRTGDLARWQADGSLAYVGRNDHQIKVRGHRVEAGEIEAHLRTQPGVTDAVVLAQEDARGQPLLMGYVVADFAQLKQSHRGGPADADPNPVREWQAVHDATYAAAELGPSFVGRESSYTHQPIPASEMDEWLRGTVERIRALGPRRVIEIGCGTGLLIEALAPDCERYRAIDFSGEAIKSLGRWLRTKPSLRHVRLQECSALQFVQQEPRQGGYDTVILNSVIQYFPDVEYLQAVLTGAASQLSSGGRIFIGDVRNLGLLKVFHSSVQLSRAAPELRVRQLRARVAHALAREKELLLDPGYFATLPQHLAAVSAVHLLLKRGSSDSEMTRYRYDVVLEINGVPANPPREQLDWRENDELLSVAGIARRRPASVLIRGIENRRLCADVAAGRVIDTAEEGATAEDLRRALRDRSLTGEDPEALCRYAEQHGYRAAASFTPGCDSGRFDMSWHDRTERVGTAGLGQVRVAAHAPSRPREALHYANDPWKTALRRELAHGLQKSLAEELPPYMVPAAVVVLDSMPVSPNGKLDRRALPSPDLDSHRAHEYQAPRGKLEQALARMWEEVLSVQRIGRDDNFFELGGQSLLGMRLLLKVADGLRITLGSLTIFQCPTIREMAEMLDRRLSADRVPSDPPSGDPAVAVRAKLVGYLETLQPVRSESGIGPRRPSDIVPLSYSQQWHWNRWQSWRASFRIPCTFTHVSGDLDVGALRRSIAELCRHHEALRMRVVTRDEIPQQQFGDAETCAFSSTDLAGTVACERDASVKRAVIQLFARHVDPSVGPAFETRLVKLDDREHVLVTVMDHLIGDAASRVILLRDLWSLYSQCVLNSDLALPEISAQFADYAVWQQGAHRAGNGAHQGYWMQRLAGAQRVRVFTDERIAGTTRLKMGCGTMFVEAATVRQLSALARRERTTLAMSMTAAYAALLFRWCNTTDLVIPFLTTGRSFPEIQRTVGNFACPLFLRVQCFESDDFLDLLRRVTREYADAQEHSDLGAIAAQSPPPEFVLNPEINWVPREFPVSRANELDHAEVDGLGGLRLRPYPLELSPEDVGAALEQDFVSWESEPAVQFMDRDDGIAASLLYASDRVATRSVERFLGSLRTVVQTMASHPDTRLTAMHLGKGQANSALVHADGPAA